MKKRGKSGIVIVCAALLAVVLAVLPHKHASENPGELPAPRQPDTEITLVFAGDLMQHVPQVNAARRGDSHDYTDCFQYIKPFFESADLALLNLETTLTEGPDYTGYPRFASPLPLAEAIRDMGVDIVATANNHTCDQGETGIRTTLAALSGAGLRHTGTFADSAMFRDTHPLYVEVKNTGFAFLNYTYGTNGLPVPRGIILNQIDTARIAADLRSVDRSRAHHVVVFFHWGEEYQRQPNAQQRELARLCHTLGADLVIGSHPHVLQPLEPRLRSDSTLGGLTAWSLGNFVSNQRMRYSDGSMILKVTITRPPVDSPPRYEAGYLLTWVHAPMTTEGRKYFVLPSYVADTLLSKEPVAEAIYRRFISDSRDLLEGEPYFHEITALPKNRQDR